jgi:O-antigen/teichoic acid export membrane protein
MQRLSRTIFRNSFVGVAAHVAMKLLAFVAGIFFLRYLGPHAVGEYAAVFAFGQIFIFIADLGLSPYTVREVARLRERQDGATKIAELYGSVLRLRLLLSALAVTLVMLFAWATQRPAVMIAGIALNMVGLVMFGIQGTSEAVLLGFERHDIPAKAKVWNQVVRLAFSALFLWVGLNYFGLIGGGLIGTLVMLVICWRSLGKIGLLPGKGEGWYWGPLLQASLPFGLIAFALGLSYNFDTVLLNLFRSTTETAYYAAAYGLVFQLMFLSNAINTALYPTLSREAMRTTNQLPAAYERCLRYLLLLALPLAFGIATLAGPIVIFVYGESYRPMIPALQIVIWALPLMFVSEFLGYMVVIDSRERFVARAVIYSTVVNIGLNLALVPWLGLYGAATMTLLTEVVLICQYLWILRQVLRRFNWGLVLGRPLLAALLMSLAVRLVGSEPLGMAIAVGALVYGGLIVTLRVVGRDEYDFVRGLLRRAAPQPEAGAGD